MGKQTKSTFTINTDNFIPVTPHHEQGIKLTCRGKF